MRLLSPLMGKTTGILLLLVQLKKTSPSRWWKKLDDVYSLRHNITMLDRFEMSYQDCTMHASTC